MPDLRHVIAYPALPEPVRHEVASDDRVPFVARPCSIFVSFAHADCDPGFLSEYHHHRQGLLGRFQDELNRILRDLPRVPGAPRAEEVFVDLQRLAGEPAWREAIAQAIDSCKLFILLVSPDSIRADSFCLEKELLPALKRANPPKVTTVLLRPVVKSWVSIEVGSKDLGSFNSGGLPRRNGKALAIADPGWGSADLAWAAMSEDLAVFIRRAFGLPDVVADGIPQPDSVSERLAHDPPVPYLCNQSKVVDRFVMALDQLEARAQGQALFVAVQGSRDDAVYEFSVRLGLQETQDYFVNWGLSLVERRRFMNWPDVSDLSPEEVERLTLRQWFKSIDSGLSADLVGCRTREDAAQCLVAFLRGCRSPVQIHANVPYEVRLARPVLDVLLGTLEACRPEHDELRRLQMFLGCEQHPGTDQAKPFHWLVELSTERRQRSTLVVLSPLECVQQKHLEGWYRAHVQFHLPNVTLDDVENWFREATSFKPKPDASWAGRLSPLRLFARQPSPGHNAAPPGLRLGPFARQFLDRFQPADSAGSGTPDPLHRLPRR